MLSLIHARHQQLGDTSTVTPSGASEATSPQGEPRPNAGAAEISSEARAGLYNGGHASSHMSAEARGAAPGRTFVTSAASIAAKLAPAPAPSADDIKSAVGELNYGMGGSYPVSGETAQALAQFIATSGIEQATVIADFKREAEETGSEKAGVRFATRVDRTPEDSAAVAELQAAVGKIDYGMGGMHPVSDRTVQALAQFIATSGRDRATVIADFRREAAETGSENAGIRFATRVLPTAEESAYAAELKAVIGKLDYGMGGTYPVSDETVLTLARFIGQSGRDQAEVIAQFKREAEECGSESHGLRSIGA